MKRLNLNVYKEYIDHVKKYGTHSSEAQDNAFKMLADLTGTPSIYDSHMERDDDQPYPEEEKARVQNFLKSLRINGKELFSGGDAVSDSNYREKLVDAMTVIAAQMQTPKATQVAYVQKEDGRCEAIIPEVPVISSPTKPEKPAWYKRFFQSLIPSWRQEVQQYKQKVDEFDKKNKDYKANQEFVEFAAKLEERAHKRELQTAAFNARKNKNICNQEIRDFFDKTPKEIQVSYKVTENSLIQSVGRENVPVGFAIGMMMAQENMTFDQAREQTAEKKRAYGEKFDQFFKKATEIENMPEEKEEDKEKKMRRFKEEIVPVVVDVMNAYATESIRSINKDSADSIAKDGLRNNILNSYCQGITQMISATMRLQKVPTDPLCKRQMYAIAMGEEICKRAEALNEKEELSLREKALKEFVSAPRPDTAISDRSLTEAGNMEKRDVVNVYLNALDSLNACATANRMSRLNYTSGLFNCVIEGEMMKAEDEVAFGAEGFWATQCWYYGLKTMPDSVKKQFDDCLYVNAAVKEHAFTLYSRRFEIPTAPVKTTETMNQFLEGLKQGKPFPGQTEGFKNPEVKKLVDNLHSVIKNQDRKKTSVAKISRAQAAKSGNQATKPTNQAAAPTAQATNSTNQATAPVAQATALANQAAAPPTQQNDPPVASPTPNKPSGRRR